MRKLISFAGLAAGLVAVSTGTASAQALTVAGNPQHTGVYTGPVQTMNRIRWQTTIDTSNSGAFAHYGQPLVTAANTVITPVKIAGNSFTINAYSGVDGSPKYSLSTDYVLPTYNWIPLVQPVVTVGPSGQSRLYYPGAGGSLYYVDNVDSNTPTAPTRIVFYTDLATYNGNAANYNSTIFVNSPITADANGTIFFGFRVQGTAPAPLNTTQSGIARIDKNGNATYVLAGDATADGSISRVAHNHAPALSNDGQTVYVAMKGTTAYYAYLVGLDATTLATKYKVFLWDPRNNGNPAGVLDDTTSSPMVGPDGDVYLGTFGNPYNGSRGFLQHFNSTLSVEKTPGGFGWDHTPAVVPATMVPSYKGTSSYLLFGKYNNYAGVGDGNGENKMAVLDPNATQVDPHASANGMLEMREVLTVIGNTPDAGNIGVGTENAVREWCVNAIAVHPASNSVFFNSEDGHATRWNLALNSLVENVELNAGIGQPYVPTTIGPDGTIYTLNGGNLFAMGNGNGDRITLGSSIGDHQTALLGQSITFTAIVKSTTTGTPTGTVTFTDRTFDGTTTVDTTLATNVPLTNGACSITKSNLTAGGTFNGNHFITATYNGDGTFPPVSMTRIQKIHSNASATALAAVGSPANYGQPVVLNATVTSVPSGAYAPNGMVLFRDGNVVLGQAVPDGSGVASITATNIPAGNRTITAEYYGDVHLNKSSGTTNVKIEGLTGFTLSANTVRGNGTVTGTVTRSSAAPAGGTVVNLSSSSPRASVPATVTIAAGATSANFTINTTNPTTANVSATITASGEGTLTQNLTIQPANYASFVDQTTLPNPIVAGQTYQVILHYKNTGSTTWTSAANYKLQSQNPGGNTTWGFNRIPLTNGPVAPNGTATFKANITAPSTAGAYNFQWSPIQEGIGSFGPASTNQVVNVAVAADAARFVSQTVPTTLVTGQDFTPSLVFKNVGTNTWTNGATYKLVSRNPYNNTTWGTNTVALPASVSPNANVTFSPTLQAPSTPGTYQFQWSMLKASSSLLFGDLPPSVTITVTQAANNAQFVSQSLPVSVGPGTSFQATMVLKNTGTATWDAASGFSLKSQNPAGNTTWGTATIPVSGSVPPNSNATFTQAFTAPSTPGTYHFQWRMFNGSSFGQYTPDLVITVSADAAQYISRNGATTVNAGADFYVQNTMKNTGTTTWSAAGGYLMLSQNPTGNTVFGQSIINFPNNNPVAPGASVTLTRLCTAPITPGTYPMLWSMAKGHTVFGEHTALVNITVVQGPDNAQFVSQTGVPTTVAHGATFNATITMKNLGTATWDGTYALTSIGSNNFGVASIASGSVAPNANGTFTTTFTAPATPGTYTFQFRMKHGSPFFGQASTPITITVT